MKRFDTLLLAKYGIFQPTDLDEGIVVVHPLEEMDDLDRLDLREFAEFMLEVNAQEESPTGLTEPPEEDERLFDEP